MPETAGRVANGVANYRPTRPRSAISKAKFSGWTDLHPAAAPSAGVGTRRGETSAPHRHVAPTPKKITRVGRPSQPLVYTSPGCERPA
jgi:hypothetical protein